MGGVEAADGANESAQCVPVKRYKRKHTADDVDVSRILPAEIAALHVLRASLHTLARAGDSEGAASKREEINTLVKHITALPVCMVCFIEAPSAHVRNNNLCLDSWRYACGKLCCRFCGAFATADGSEEHVVQIRESLRRRVGWQLGEALSHVPKSCAPGRQAKLKAAIKQLNIRSGRGKGVRAARESKQQGVKAKQQAKGVKAAARESLVCLVGGIHMTLERLFPEDGVERERAGLLLALRCLEAR